ncbi:hypothetical protein B5X24_HaOG215461 [Helicoverpa armigera]|nr:hypothetical protein B5X24_HaOG215461 [Helicoverpa armigera]
MLNRTLKLYTIFAICIVGTRSISITSIERLASCGRPQNKPIQGCIGTFILPNVAITTSYCAENCQYLGKLRIIRTFIHPHYRNYVLGNNFFARNDIALIITKQDFSKRKLIKLSALDTLSTIGLKALIPIMDENKPRLRVTLIERCIKEQQFGYYVCANNRVTKQTIEVCRRRQEQGVPLLLDGRIYGIMGITDKDTCVLPQRSFTAVGPALPWISSTVRTLGYKNEILTTLHDTTTTRKTPPTTTRTTKTTPKTTTTKTTTTKTTTTPVTQPTFPPAPPSIPPEHHPYPTQTTEKIVFRYVPSRPIHPNHPTRPIYPSHIIPGPSKSIARIIQQGPSTFTTTRRQQTRTFSQFFPSRHVLAYNNYYLSLSRTTTPNNNKNDINYFRNPHLFPKVNSYLKHSKQIHRAGSTEGSQKKIEATLKSVPAMRNRPEDSGPNLTSRITSAKEFRIKAITFRPPASPSRRTISKPTPSKVLETSTKPTTSTTNILPFIRVLANNKTTNVMDWFNVVVKEKLKNITSAFYVISPSIAATGRPPLNFLDLT